MIFDLLIPCANVDLDGLERMFFDGYYDDAENTPIGLDDFKVVFITDDLSISKLLRASLERFSNHFKNIKIYDGGHYLVDAVYGIQTLLSELHAKRIIPIIVGTDFASAQKFAKSIDSKVYLICNHTYDNDTVIEDLCVEYIGYQRHLMTMDNLQNLEESSFNSMSLGKLRSFPNQLEPTLRDAQVAYLNLNVNRSSDVPNVEGALPSGLNAEEICQVAKYIGTASHIKALLVGIDNIPNPSKQEGDLLAEIIWYFLEGVHMTMQDHPNQNKDYNAFIVASKYFDQDLEFLRNNQSNKWWLKVTDSQNIDQYLACSMDDYQTAAGDELSDRLQKFIFGLD